MEHLYDLLEKGFGYYDKIEYLHMLYQVRDESIYLKLENARLKKENTNLKNEIATMNANIVANLENEIRHMRTQVNTVIHNPKCRTIEELDP